mmetsp:Transcript_22768/g.35053  ORF Transcript_22768/g.35053 Transcript_22768/m.35053 type:complete len:125 (+) Transcript_22768:2981-3355(+)
MSKLQLLQDHGDRISAYGPASPPKPVPIRFIKKELKDGSKGGAKVFDPSTMPLQIDSANQPHSMSVCSQVPKPIQEKNQLIYSKIKLSTKSKNRTRQEKIGPSQMTRSYQLQEEQPKKNAVILH